MSVKCQICQNDIWEVTGNTAACTNCGNQRPFHSRKSQAGSPSQLAKIEAIRKHFLGKCPQDGNDTGKLDNWSVAFQDGTGYAYVSVDTSSNPYLNSGGSFKIGPRGRVECFSVHSLTLDKEFWKEAWERDFSK